MTIFVVLWRHHMFLNYLRNRKMHKLFSQNSSKYDSDGSFIEYVLVKSKNGNYFVIRHIQYADNGALTTFGTYKIIDNYRRSIGYLKYTFDDRDKSNIHMNLGDIYFDPLYRNIGLGTKVLALFEQRAITYGAHHIEGKLSDVDEITPFDKELRDSFYKKLGYEIIDNNSIYKELD